MYEGKSETKDNNKGPVMLIK